jgi:hypothetical protein
MSDVPSLKLKLGDKAAQVGGGGGLTFERIIQDSVDSMRRRTPELTRAEHKAFKMKIPNDYESHAVEASG